MPSIGSKQFFTIIFLFLLFINTCYYAQTKIVDDFESIDDWEIVSSEGVSIQLSQSEGVSGNAIKLDFNFISGAGYGGFQKTFPLDLPENFQFSFYIRADAPSNNLEFKLIDESGDNVWWRNQVNFEFPKQWKKITIKKRNIEFAWGPAQDKNLKKTHKLQFMIASFNGGKGSVYFDNFRFEPLEGAADTLPAIRNIEVSTNMHDAAKLFDRKESTLWKSGPTDNQNIIIDLGDRKEYGGLIIDWDEKTYAENYKILASNDKVEWDEIYNVTNGKGGRSYINLNDSESRYIKLDLLRSSEGKGYVINELQTEGYKFSETPEVFISNIAKDKPEGYFPKYIYNTQSYWTVTGVNADEKEALINEEGMVEVDKRQFSIEPFLYMEGKLLTWKDAKHEQGLEEEYLPIPFVKRSVNGLELETKIFASGEAGSSVLYIKYNLHNNSASDKKGNLFLALRPFQVNPTWQFLNLKGGIAKIESIHYENNRINVNDDKLVIPFTKPEGFGASEFDNGDILDFISRDTLPEKNSLEDHTGFASAALQYNFDIPSGESRTFYLAVPFYKDEELAQIIAGNEAAALWEKRFQENVNYWKSKLNTVQFNLPKEAEKIVHILKSNLAYILINKDKAGIQPGSRSYDRSWIRDGSLTSSALLKLGITKEPREFITWYSQFQYENGKVPCVVDRRGADPTPENDSHGQLIFALMQYFNFTKDTTLLRERFENVEAAVKYMNYLRNLRRTEEYKTDDKKLFYGLLPESISHEGYSAKPMHSYWDDFFALKGYKDAEEIARILGENEKADEFGKDRDEFKTDLYNSINMSIQIHNIDYIPGCAELGDFDATSTAIAIYPVNELQNLPQPYGRNTFEKYYDFFINRRESKIQWDAYTPYEVRTIGSFIYLGEKEKAYDLLEYFLNDIRPSGWNHWAEVVWNDINMPRFIGDMPHTWVGSDFISSIRSFFAYEDELAKALVLGAGIKEAWADSPEGIEIKNLPTYYGNINYSIKKAGTGKYIVSLSGLLNIPEGNIKFKSFNSSPLKKVYIDGKEQTSSEGQEIIIKYLPAKIEIEY